MALDGGNVLNKKTEEFRAAAEAGDAAAQDALTQKRKELEEDARNLTNELTATFGESAGSVWDDIVKFFVGLFNNEAGSTWQYWADHYEPKPPEETAETDEQTRPEDKTIEVSDAEGAPGPAPAPGKG